MRPCFNPTCDRHGHMIAGVGGSAQTIALFVPPTAKEITRFSETGSVPICKAALLAGDPAERISTLAQDVHADVIVVARSNPILTQLLNVDQAVKMPCRVLVYNDKNA